MFSHSHDCNCVGSQVLLGCTPAGWNVTLINNHGVVKQPATAPVVDASQLRRVVLTLKQGTLATAWASSGAATAPAPLAISNGTTVEVTVAAGDLMTVGLELSTASVPLSG